MPFMSAQAWAGFRGRDTRILALVLLAGTALAFAGCEGCKDRVTSPVILPPLSSVTVSPDTDTLRVGERVTFSAVAVDTGGNVVPGVPFAWESTQPGIFTVSTTGVVRAVGEGWGYLIASAGGFSDSAVVAVYPDTGWFVQPTGTSNDLNGVFFLPDGRTGYAVGNAGTVRFTLDAGATWAQQFPQSSFNLNSVSIVDSTYVPKMMRAWICGNNGTLLRTVDAGALWSRASAPTSSNLNDVWFADPDTGWAVGNGGVILRTVNAAATNIGDVVWTRLLPAVTSSNLRSVGFSDARNGWAVADNGQVLGTHDGGASWYIYQPAVTTQNLDAVWRRSLDLAWAVGSLGTVLRTVAPAADSAQWQASGVPNFNLYGVHFSTDEIGYAAGYSTLSGAGAVLRSDDAGVTWTSQESHTNFRLNDVFFTDPLHGWAVGNGGTVLHTARGGRR